MGMGINLMGEEIRFAAFEEEGVVELTRSQSGLRYNSTHHVIGIWIDLLEMLQSMFHFHIHQPIFFVDNFLPVGETETHITERNETIFHLMSTSRIDMTLGYLYLMPSRSKVASAMWPLSREEFKVYFRQPELARVDYNPFSEQFSTNLALAFVTILVLSGVILALFMSFSFVSQSQSECQFHSTKKYFSWFWSHFYDSMFWAIGTWGQQGTSLNVSKWEGKAVMALTSQLCLFMYSLYSALIIATLIQKRLPIQRVEQLFQHQYSFYALPHTASRLFIGNESRFSWSPSQPFTKVKGQSDANEYGSMQSIQRIFTHRHAHLDTADLFHPTFQKVFKDDTKDVCTLSVLPYKGGSLQGGAYARKDFKYKNDFNLAFARIREAGISSRLVLGYEGERLHKCSEDVSFYQENLGMSYVGSIFTALISLYVGTLIIFGVEHFMSAASAPVPTK